MSLTDAAAVARSRPPGRGPLTRSEPRRGERVVMSLLFAAAAVSVLTTVGIVVVLFTDAFSFFREVGLGEFFLDTRWAPNFGTPGTESFRAGVWPLVVGTLLVTAIALAVAVPLGLATAVYLSDYARPPVRRVLKPTLEVLAGVPTIVLGYFALNAMTPALRSLGIDVEPFNALSAGMVMGIMIVPTVASLSEDAMSAVPDVLRLGAYGLGATKRQVVTRVVFPAALSGIVAAVILAIGRAIGETMIVAVAAGNSPILTFDPRDGVQTMTAYIVQTVSGEAPRGSIQYSTIFAVGALLFVITLSLNLMAQAFVRRFREEY